MKKIASQTSSFPLLLVAAGMILLSGNPAFPDGKPYMSGRSEHEDVYKHSRAHDILSFRDILKLVSPHIDGEIIETKFDFEEDMPVYEFKYIDLSGRVMEIYVDARNGKILKNEEDE